MADNNFDPSRRKFIRNAGLLGLSGAIGVSCSTGSKSSESEESNGEMTYRVNPNTGDRVSILGFGCMRLPTMGMASGDESDTRIDQEAVNAQVDYALEHGVNYFDTSPAYCQGQSESVMGEALSRHPRDKYLIATKLSNFAPQTWPREESIAMFERSLTNLRTDYIDYLLLHSVAGDMDTYNARYRDNGMLEYLKEQRDNGRIRNLGFSYHGDPDVFDHLLAMMDRGEVHWDFVQIQSNYINWEHPAEQHERNVDACYLYNELDRRGIPAVIMEPLLGGRLAKVPQPVENKMRQLRPDDSPATWAFRFAATPERVLTVLSGMTYMEHLQENVRTYSPLEPISDDEHAFLMSAAFDILENHAIPCTGCQYCMPCPYGVDIPGVFAQYNDLIAENSVPRDSRSPEYDRLRRHFLKSFDRTVDPRRQASHCIQCHRCEHHCPQSIAIADRLEEIADYQERLRRNKV